MADRQDDSVGELEPTIIQLPREKKLRKLSFRDSVTTIPYSGTSDENKTKSREPLEECDRAENRVVEDGPDETDLYGCCVFFTGFLVCVVIIACTIAAGYFLTSHF